jgi:hypothetical protein
MLGDRFRSSVFRRAGDRSRRSRNPSISTGGLKGQQRRAAGSSRPAERRGAAPPGSDEAVAGWPLEVDVRSTDGPAAAASVTACPSCGSSMAVEELDLVHRLARLVCGDCGLMRARRLPTLSHP